MQYKLDARSTSVMCYVCSRINIILTKIKQKCKVNFILRSLSFPGSGCLRLALKLRLDGRPCMFLVNACCTFLISMGSNVGISETMIR